MKRDIYTTDWYHGRS